MASIGPKHKELDEQGIGRCSVPMFSGYGGEAGFCDEPAYGCRMPAAYHTHWDGYKHASDGRYAGYVPALACPMHGGPRVRAYMDGNAWCAVKADFINLQESDAGFGDTKEAAYAELKRLTGATP